MISQSQDLLSLEGCITYDGSIELSSTLGGDIIFPDDLETITGALTADGISATSIQALGLSTIGTIPQSGGQFDDSLAIMNSPRLTAVSFPQLQSIGGDLFIAKNPAWKKIEGFSQLKRVEGNIDVTGNFDELSLPALNYVGKGVNIETTSRTFTCPISDARTNGIIHGTGFVCVGNVQNPSSGVGANYTTNPTTTVTVVHSDAFRLQQSGLEIECIR